MPPAACTVCGAPAPAAYTAPASGEPYACRPCLCAWRGFRRAAAARGRVTDGDLAAEFIRAARAARAGAWPRAFARMCGVAAAGGRRRIRAAGGRAT